MTIRVLGNLKGPYTPVSEGEGHGYLGAILYDDVEDKVQCHACGQWFKAVTNRHTLCIHGQSLDEHKRQFGLPRTHPICRPETSELFRKNMANRKADGRLQNPWDNPARHKELHARMMTARLEAEPYTIHWRNKQGTCDEQIRQALEQLMEINGGLLPPKLTWPRGLYSACKSYCGGANKALRQFGLLNVYSGTKGRRYTDEELLGVLRSFKEKRGRVPVKRDFKPGSPDASTFEKRFGSWSNAKKLAGV